MSKEETKFEAKDDLFVSSFSYPKRKHTKVKFLENITKYNSELYKYWSEAKTCIWCAVSFVNWDFEFVVQQKSSRKASSEIRIPWWQHLKNLKEKNPKLDIRVLFWTNDKRIWGDENINTGSKKRDWEDHISKYELDKYIQFRWDESPNKHHCHHQKNHIIDYTYAFIGGIVMTNASQTHDTGVILQGEAVVDVMENFILRWNHCHDDYLHKTNIQHNFCHEKLFQHTVDISLNDVKQQWSKQHNHDSQDGITTQIAWTVSPKLYPGVTYENGESSIYRLYLEILGTAKSTIYLESQHCGEYKILKLLKDLLSCNSQLKVFYLVPITPLKIIVECKHQSLDFALQAKANSNVKLQQPRYHDTFEMLSSLQQFDNFLLAGLCNCDVFIEQDTSCTYEYRPIYVHSKLCVVDGKYFTIGSANMVDISFIHDHTEMNVFGFDTINPWNC
ncbi:phospholipase D/Transphosphatidylase [Reticulomyxa filosa]|uniref:phospholipase D n=1 Tax=Reticulomyxa filosa TaxID=46433 RepID=X6M232_RETFI|nr:phospholipase D/Transphosphatidylase [Reticulomyxa filosa]|eukprot:ETO07656.1 phospholipase D/Transphosphatidylase [Reticulomyxa filosa]